MPHLVVALFLFVAVACIVVAILSFLHRRPAFGAAALVLCAVSTVGACVYSVRHMGALTGWKVDRTPSGSMEPTVRKGEVVAYRLHAYDDRLPERGEVVVFEMPMQPGVLGIKRVIGLPGDRLEVRRGHVLVNGRPIDEPYLDEDHRIIETIPELTVSAGHAWLLGDNRRASADSRMFGEVSVAKIVGKVETIVDSDDPDRAGIPVR